MRFRCATGRSASLSPLRARAALAPGFLLRLRRQIKVVEPNETGDLDIIPGEDYCTLVTCTPYSINTHRLLVRGVRTEYNGELESDVRYQELQTGTVARRLIDVLPWLLVAGTVSIGTEGILLWLLIRRKKKREKEELQGFM